jgi:hypothetical protein
MFTDRFYEAAGEEHIAPSPVKGNLLKRRHYETIRREENSNISPGGGRASISL